MLNYYVQECANVSVNDVTLVNCGKTLLTRRVIRNSVDKAKMECEILKA